MMCVVQCMYCSYSLEMLSENEGQRSRGYPLNKCFIYNPGLLLLNCMVGDANGLVQFVCTGNNVVHLYAIQTELLAILFL